ncbi:MAG TPA: GGDEF domain-containing protein [Solirubrobacteraceae bacterium]|nr:GGDEF domain-containing protein [Solirubrobacteraceae bacterium]
MEVARLLIENRLERERMLDMEERLRTVRPRAGAVMIAGLLALGPWYGWWLPLPVLLALGLQRLVDVRLPAMRHPELAVFGCWLAVVAMIALAIALAGAPPPLLVWFAFPVIPLVARFPRRLIAVGIAAILAALALTVLIGHPAAALARPPLLIAPAGALVAIGLYALTLMESEAQHRNDALIDSLTGMLNRKALARHVEELEQQARFGPLRIGALVADIDHFKAINDRFGHAHGDAVLRAVAQVIRAQLRTFDHAFRLGGEEFLVLLPGADAEGAAQLAERIRAAVRACPQALAAPVTLSCGIAALQGHGHFDFHALFASADEALYAAKRGGRNRIATAA